jgi:hypothetical protein
MSTIFRDFRQFSAKNGVSLKNQFPIFCTYKLAVLKAKNAIFSPDFLAENFLKR